MSNTRVVELLVVDPETVLKGASSVGSVAVELAIPLVNPDIKEIIILEEAMLLATPQEVKAISLEIRRDRRN